MKIIFATVLCIFGFIKYSSSKKVGYQITFFNTIEYGYYGFLANTTNSLEGNPDIKTFKVLENKNFAKDKTNIWCREHLLKDADLTTFKPTDFYCNNGHIFYSKDKKHVWRDETLLTDADPSTFMQLAAGSDFVKDKNHVYYQDKVLQDVDPVTFVFLDDFYAKDKKVVYFFDEKIENADASTFQLIKHSSFSKDKNHVYHSGKLLLEADPNSFELIEAFADLAKDKNHVFKYNKILNADPATFKVKDNGEWHDINGLVKRESILGYSDCE